MSREPLPPQTIERIGLRPHPLQDLYHWLLVVSWPTFLGLAAGGFFLGNALFAGIYLLRPGSIAGSRPGFSDAFFFSVHTMATIGYGTMSPATVWAHLVVVVEALCGLFLFAVVTGLTFAKFSRPTARVLFSRVAVIAPRDGVPCLMFRMANERGNQIVEARLHAALALDGRTAEGEAVRRIMDLRLLRERTPMFALTWTAVHPIDEASPLYGLPPAALAAGGGQIIVSLTGLDDTLAQTVYARHVYGHAEVQRGMRFADILHVAADGRRRIDFGRFHDTQPL
jgi:inward rectifier potassium channel